MAKDLFLGLDIGTTSVKAGLFDAAGHQMEYYNSPYPTQRGRDGTVEQDPDIWLEHIWTAIAKFAGARDLSRLGGIGITSQVNTHVFVDENGNALAPAIVWQDNRCAPQAAGLDGRISTTERINWWGAPMPVDASHCLSRMKWMADHRPDIWKKTRWVMLPKDYCILKLTGEAISDPISNIGMVGPDLGYIPELLDLLPGAARRLPPLAAKTEIAGVVRHGSPECAGVQVAVSTMDAWAGFFGIGVQIGDQGVYLSGTSEVLGVVSDRVVPTPGVLVFPKTDGLTVHAGPTQSGGGSVLWYCKLFDTDPQAMAELVAAMNFDDPCPLFLPHLQGERAPLWDIHSRGTLLGMDARTGPAEIARAVYEGVALSARLLAGELAGSADIKIAGYNCGGGGFRSDIFNQIRADILGTSLRRASVSDPGVLGAACMAAVACGTFDDMNSALAEIVQFDRTYDPNEKRRGRYDDLFGLYQETYQATRAINRKLSKPR